ncbi:ankyrin repeat-containing domain protein [Colletotrichum acutatum]|uniref:Ankyrin repeat-containing domain protein n=1 Tax=Glomerella acutata TaxID=27357 RepID=A0AAD8UCU2_GLOAC|nr:ankyrin repeat-containing domain protein [Colletotrichum acutatum]KAK1720316.1 ankyrin repeat-containing domain protein [Colletotrichum acutatum]
MEKVFNQAQGFDFKSDEGRYLICIAAYFVSLSGLKSLTHNGVEADGADTTGRTPLSYIAEGLNLRDPHGLRNLNDTYKGLLESSSRRSERTSFERALECAQLLIDNGAQVDLSDKHGRTALSYASLSPEYTSWCLQHKASVSSQDLIGRTPLSYASQIDSGNGSVVGMLLRHGADPNSRDVAGRTPLWFAVHPGSSGNVSRLRHACKDSSLVISKDIFWEECHHYVSRKWLDRWY